MTAEGDTLAYVRRLRRCTEDQKKNKTGNLRASAETTGYSGEGCPSTGKGELCHAGRTECLLTQRG
jgi:hypothetical protein